MKTKKDYGVDFSAVNLTKEEAEKMRDDIIAEMTKKKIYPYFVSVYWKRHGGIEGRVANHLWESIKEEKK